MPKPIKPAPVPAVPTPVPQRSDRANFAARGDAMMTAFPGLVSGINTTVDYIDEAADFVAAEADRAQAQANAASDFATDAQGYAGQSTTEANRAELAADNAAQASLSVANFKGEWSTLAGALNMPATVSHAGMIWLLLQNLPNVAAAEPGVSAAWTPALVDAVLQTKALGNVDLNTALTSGFFGFGTPTNGPAGVADSQLIVSRGGETLMQIVVEKTTGAMFVRAASALSTAPVFSAWRRVALHSDVVVPLAGGAIDCHKGNYFSETVAGARTLAFSNIPGGSYSCVLEVNRTSGAITFPAGTVWSGVAPTLSAGRHLFFFQRAQLGTAGWYASSLTGYTA